MLVLLPSKQARKPSRPCGYFLGRPLGAIQKLIAELPDLALRNRMEELIEEGAVLDRYYIPTRYPNGLPDLMPGQYYFQKDALLCIESAQRLINLVKICMGI